MASTLRANLQPTIDIAATVKNALAAVIQSGSATFAAATKAVTFDVAFATAPIVMLSGSATTTAILTLASVTTTGFVANGTNGEVFNWVAF